jgi:hypothetical protein
MNVCATVAQRLRLVKATAETTMVLARYSGNTHREKVTSVRLEAVELDMLINPVILEEQMVERMVILEERQQSCL